MTAVAQLRQRCDEVRERVAQAATQSGVDPTAITVVAISKTRPRSEVEAVIELGFTEIGESRIQETETKYKDGKPACRLHLVGHLQRNKVKRAVALFDLIQSVDSIRLAQLIDEEAGRLGRRLPILLEVNSSGEQQKYGFAPESVEAAATEIGKLANIELAGLMTVGPLTDAETEIKRAFAATHELFKRLQSSGAYPEFRILSMGMSDDFPLAIAEGANMLRLGTILFGPRVN
ncbi:MAG: YggS family pyridoxal phosphate-dependent enzyme [bacterium]